MIYNFKLEVMFKKSPTKLFVRAMRITQMVSDLSSKKYVTNP